MMRRGFTVTGKKRETVKTINDLMFGEETKRPINLVKSCLTLPEETPIWKTGLTGAEGSATLPFVFTKSGTPDNFIVISAERI